MIRIVTSKLTVVELTVVDCMCNYYNTAKPRVLGPEMEPVSFFMTRPDRPVDF